MYDTTDTKFGTRVLVTQAGLDHNASSKEQSALKAGMGHEVAHAGFCPEATKRNAYHHVAQLATSAESNYTLEITLIEAKNTGCKRSQRTRSSSTVNMW